MNQHQKHTVKTHARKSKSFFLCSVFCSLALLASLNSKASSVYVALDSYDYDFVAGADLDLDLSLVGAAFGGTFDLSDTTFLQYEFGKWSDRVSVSGPMSSLSDFDSRLFYIGLGAKWNSWEFIASYSEISDNVSTQLGNEIEFTGGSNVSIQSFKFLANHNKEIGLWNRFYSVGLQYDDAEFESFSAQSDQVLLQGNDNLYAMLKFGGDYFIEQKDQAGWFLGASLSLYQELASNEDTSQILFSDTSDLFPALDISPVTRRGNVAGFGGGNGGAARVNRTSGDNFGLLGLYSTYQINSSWSVDWSSSIGFAGDQNSNSHALTLGFIF